MAKKYYWFKMKEDFFNLKEIRKLRRVAGGDTYVIIYLKMILLSLKLNGGLIFEGIENDFAEQISLEIDEDLENVKIAISFLIANKLLIESETPDKFLLPYAIACTGKEGESAERVRRYRENRLLQSNSIPLQSNGTVTKCNTEIEKEIEKEIEIENPSGDKSQKQSRTNYTESIQTIIDYLNSVCGTNYKSTTKSTIGIIKARLKEGFTIEDFKAVIHKKYNDWCNDPKMVAYLRPQTLFGNNFEGYLNQRETDGRTLSDTDKALIRWYNRDNDNQNDNNNQEINHVPKIEDDIF